MYLPADVAAQALDAVGIEHTLGDLQEGSRVANVCLRAYGNCLRSLLRTAHWNFARKTEPLVLLADASNTTGYYDRLVPTPWRFSYQYPIDCLEMRSLAFGTQQVPPSGNIAAPVAPLTTGFMAGHYGHGERTIPFKIAADFNHPPIPGQDAINTPGVAAAARTVILTDQPGAVAVYTALILYPNLWDPLFREAFVAYLASEIALPLSTDKRMGLSLRAQQIALSKEKIMHARAMNGNEGPRSSDIPVDWIRARTGYRGGHSGWHGVGFADGSVF